MVYLYKVIKHVKQFGFVLSIGVFVTTLLLNVVPYHIHAASVPATWESDSTIKMNDVLYVNRAGDSEKIFMQLDIGKYDKDSRVYCTKDSNITVPPSIGGSTFLWETYAKNYGVTFKTILVDSNSKVTDFYTNGKYHEYVMEARDSKGRSIPSSETRATGNIKSGWSIGCFENKSAQLDVTLTDPLHQANSAYVWDNQQTIVSTDGHHSFILKSGTDQFVKSDDKDTCPDYIIPTPTGEKGDYYSYGVADINNKCNYSNPKNPKSVPIAGIAAKNNQPGTHANLANTVNSVGSGGADNSCESQGGVLGWILCPVINLLDGSLNWLDTQIQGLLEVDSNKYTSSELKHAWSIIRNISYSILIPVMLVMVIGTALGFEFVSAYTVKRALPRMVAAVIFITLSWDICIFLIGLSNVVGGGILGILTKPFYANGGNMNLSSLFEAGGASFTVQWGSAALTALAGVLIFSGGLGGIAIAILLSILLSALLFVLVAFFVLLMRQMFILGLVLVAPLAIITWIFPGNDKIWKDWWSLFSKLLIMFPLIMGILATGRIFAWLLDPPGSHTGSGITPLLKFIAYIAPYILIPVTFKFAGGLFANLSGSLNDRGRGLFDRNKKLRKGLYHEAHASTKDGKNTLGTGRTGSVYRRAAAFGKDGSFSMSSAGRNRWEEAEKLHSEHVADESLKNGGPRAFNDDEANELLRQKGMTKARFIQEYAQARADKAARPVNEEDKRHAEEALARSELAIGAKVGSQTMRVAAGKFRTAMSSTAYETGSAGLTKLQADLKELQADGLITAVDAAGWMKQNRSRPEFSANSFGETVNFAQGTITAKQQLLSAYNGADPREIVGGHTRAVESFAEAAEASLELAKESGDENQIAKSMADLANVLDTLSSVSRNKAESFATRVFSAPSGVRRNRIKSLGGDLRGADGQIIPGPGIEQETVELSNRELMEEFRASNKTFLDRRREYGSAAAAAQATGAPGAGAPPPEPPAAP